MAALAELIEEQKQESFTDPTTATDEEALGILIAHHFEWGGISILKVAISALEDGNYNTEVEYLRQRLAHHETVHAIRTGSVA